jgi:transcriptional antiterminator RfaH
MTDHGKSSLVTSDPAAPTAPWCVALTKLHQEKIAKRELGNQGFETYLPMKLGKKEALPFFPGYLFVQVDWANARWRNILSTIGVRTLLLAGDRPAIIRPGFIHKMQQHEVDGVIIIKRPEERPCPFRPGDKVTVHYKHADVEGLFYERVDANRVSILVSLLGADSRVVLALDRLT